MSTYFDCLNFSAYLAAATASVEAGAPYYYFFCVVISPASTKPAGLKIVKLDISLRIRLATVVEKIRL